MSRPAILTRYAEAAAQGERDRAGRLSGRVVAFDILSRRQRDLRQGVRLADLHRRWRMKTKVFGCRALMRALLKDELALIHADIQDDGRADWAYWLDAPHRRYRVRPWRPADGEPFCHFGRCITILDGQTGKGFYGVPPDGLAMMGIDLPLEDSDRFAATFIAACRARGRRRT